MGFARECRSFGGDVGISAKPRCDDGRCGGSKMSNNASPVPAAQYLRMSTESQEYSIQNQLPVITSYATSHGFEIVKTYADPAKSGLLLKNRLGLRSLIRDVTDENKPPFRAILVYDVSRWGRFQDIDESAHYEFLCKAAGVPVHYCAEMFGNDNSLPSLIMKSMKRMMAGEYSRELSVKVSLGIRRTAELGFHPGSMPGYGLRRMLVSANRERKQLLSYGQHKAVKDDRVILVPGPEQEVQCVRQIFSMFAEKRMWPTAIARVLNEQRIPFTQGFTRTEWYPEAVR